MDFIRDTFTGADGALLEMHIGETGASWTRQSPGSTYQSEIRGGQLKRVAGMPAFSSSDYAASGALPGIPYVVDIGFIVSAQSNYGDRIQLWANNVYGGSAGQPILDLSTATPFASLTVFGSSIYYEPGPEFSTGVEYNLRIIVGTDTTDLYVNGDFIDSGATPSFYAHTILYFQIITPSQVIPPNAGVTYLRVWDGIESAPAFWTSNIGTTET